METVSLPPFISRTKGLRLKKLWPRKKFAAL
jgi:hypothetical protein